MDIRSLSFLGAAAAAIVWAVPAAAQFGGEPAVKTTLSAATQPVPGQSFNLAFKMVHPEKVHTYGPNPGETGLPTKFDWKLPEGWTAGETKWAKSASTEYDKHEGTVEHITPVTVPASAAVGGVQKVEVNASWLECDDKGCAPRKKTLTVEVTVKAAGEAAPATPAPAEPAPAAEPEKKNAEPEPAAALTAPAADPITVPGIGFTPPAEEIVSIQLLPPAAPVEAGKPFAAVMEMNHAEGYHTYGPKFEGVGKPTKITWTLPEGWTAGTTVWAKGNSGKAEAGDVYIGKVAHTTQITPPATAAAGSAHVLKARVDWLQCDLATCAPKSADVTLNVTIGGTATTSAATAAEKSAASKFNLEEAMAAVFTPGQPDYLTADGEIPVKPTLWSAILLAFVGGMILNLMPCVFPVLGLKVLSFVKLGGDDPARIRNHGLMFGIGLVLSVLALAGVLLGLKAFGSTAGWGFQQQSAGFTAFTAILMVVLGLNMYGVFEMGTSLTGVGGDLKRKTSGYTSSFMSGVLTTLVATPCSGPFMGAAIGYALQKDQTPVVTLLVFLFFGLGIAAPYVVLSFFPNLIRKLPKPGAWMETFKKAMSFLMFATAIYFLHTFSAQAGEWGRTLLLLAIVLAAIAAWIYGHWCPGFRSTRARTGGTIAMLLFASFSGYTAWTASRQKSELTAANERAEKYLHAIGDIKTANPTIKLPKEILEEDGGDLVWEEFSPELIRKLRSEGRMIYMDFTAKWCAVCQTNKLIGFGLPESARLKKRLKDLNVALVRVSFDKDDAVHDAIRARFGRDTIPLNVLYPPNGAVPLTLADGLITPSYLLEVVNKAAAAGQKSSSSSSSSASL